MATAKEKYDLARRNQANMRRVETLMLREADTVLNVAAEYDWQDTGGFLRTVVPTIVDKYGKVNAAAALQYYDAARLQWWMGRQASMSRSYRGNQQRMAERYAAARLRGEIYVAKMPEFNAADKAESIIGWGMQNFQRSGFAAMKSSVTNSLTRAVASYNRDVMLYNSALDADVVRVQRVAEPNACGFCQTLAFSSSGFTGDVRTASYAIDFHDNCRCSIETLYEGDEPIKPEYYEEFEANYIEASSTREPGQTTIERMNQLTRSN